jgi:hypothetical protein
MSEMNSLYEFVYRGQLTEEALDQAGRLSRSHGTEKIYQTIAILNFDLLDPDDVDISLRMAGVYAAITSFERSARRFVARVLQTRLSRLCGEVFPGQAEGADFFGCWLVRARCLKCGGDDDVTELRGHVGCCPRGIRRAPGGAVAVRWRSRCTTGRRYHVPRAGLSGGGGSE